MGSEKCGLFGFGIGGLGFREVGMFVGGRRHDFVVVVFIIIGRRFKCLVVGDVAQFCRVGLDF